MHEGCCTECRPQSRRAFPPRSPRGFRWGEGRPAASPGPQVPQPVPAGPLRLPAGGNGARALLKQKRAGACGSGGRGRGRRAGASARPQAGSAPRPSEAGPAMRAAALFPRSVPGTRARARELGPCFPGGGEEGASPAGRASRSREKERASRRSLSRARARPGGRGDRTISPGGGAHGGAGRTRPTARSVSCRVLSWRCGAFVPRSV